MVYPVVRFKKDSLEARSIWPKREFPCSFEVENKEYKCWGLGVDYEDEGFGELIRRLKNGDESGLISSKSDFLIILLDKEKNKIKVANGLSGFLPVFWCVESDELIVSPAFSTVFDMVIRPKLDIDEVLDYLITEYSIFFTDKTFISQVKRLPPGCVLEVARDLSYKISEPFSWEDLLAKEMLKTPLAPDVFIKEMFSCLDNNIRLRCKTLNGFQLSCDLSSGFDCGLVAYLLKENKKEFKCYSHYTRLNNDDTDPRLVKRFADYHGLEVEFLDTYDMTVFGSVEDREWNQNEFFPAGYYQPIMQRYERKKVCDLGYPVASYTGFGGDEFFHGWEMVEYVKNHKEIELNFANLVEKSGGERLFTDDALKFLTDEKRFAEKKFYSNQFGSAAIGLMSFPILWQAGTWIVSPYVDIDMIKLAQRIPLINGKRMHKQQLYKGRTDVFLPEQYRIKLPFDEQIKTFFYRKQELILQILEGSILGRLGLVRTQEIIEALRAGKIKEYIGKLHLSFINLLRLEVFLQSKGVAE